MQMHDGKQRLRCVVLGHSGAVGKALVARALASPAFQTVTLVGRRRPEPNTEAAASTKQAQGTAAATAAAPGAGPAVSTVLVDFDNLDASVFSNCDAVFCALGSTRNSAGSAENFWRIDHDYVVAAARLVRSQSPHARHFVYVSSCGANSTSWFLYPRCKGTVEQSLAALDFPHLTILRPALLETEGPRLGPRRLAESTVLAILPMVKILGIPTSRISVPVADVAAAMVAAVLIPDPTPGSRVLENPEILSAAAGEPRL